MDSNAFLEQWKIKTSTATLAGYGGEWTKAIYPVISSIGTDAGFVVNHKDSFGEINHLDFCFFPPSEEAANWRPPRVIIEHENAWSFKETQKDFWKCCLYAAPLRITIGYAGTEQQATENGQLLVSFFGQNDLPQPCGGETLIVMGWDQSPAGQKWLYWLLRHQTGSWETGQL